MAPHTVDHAFLAPLGYKAIPIKLSEEQTAFHCLYAKEHKVRGEADKTHPQNRTLFVINVPAYFTEKSLSTVFSCCGHVASVEVLEKPAPSIKVDSTSKYFKVKSTEGFKVAYVVFKKNTGLKKFNSLKLQTPLVLSENDNLIKTGIKKWITDYEMSLTDVAVLQSEIDQYMQEYDENISKGNPVQPKNTLRDYFQITAPMSTSLKEEKAKEEAVPDDEGWVTVTRKGRRPGLARTEAVNVRVTAKEKKKKAQKELLNFYAWQHRNQKKEHLAEMRKKFEEDKQKIALMRAQRKFRPY